MAWETEKFNFFNNKHVVDFDFGSDHHLVVYRRHFHKKIWSEWHFHNECFKAHRGNEILQKSVTSYIIAYQNEKL